MDRTSYFFFVFFITAGAVLTTMGALSPAWNRNGAGQMGLYSVCGCRNIDFDCKVGAGTGNPRESFFTGKTTCSEYSATRVLAAATLGFLFLGVVTSIATKGEMYNKPGFGSMDPMDVLGVGCLTLAFACGTVVVGLYVNTIHESKSNGLANLDDGAILFMTGWAIIALPWAIWFIGMVGGGEVRTALSPNSWTGMAFSNFWLTASVILVASGVIFPEWNKVLVREDLITPPDFQGVHNNMHSVVGISNQSLTTLSAITDNIITPRADTEKPDRHLHLNPWGYCLCTDIKPECEWQDADFFRGSKCDRFQSAQVFGWLTMGFALLTHLSMIFNGMESGEGHATMATFAFLTGVSAIVSLSLYGDLSTDIPGTQLDGHGFILFTIGAGLIAIVGFLVGAIMSYQKFFRIYPEEPGYSPL